MARNADLPSPDLGAIRELSQRPQWVCWKMAPGSTGKVTKIPINPIGGRNAKVTESETWGHFDDACAFARSTDANGVGYVLSGLEHISVIDLDKCVDPDTLEIEQWAQDIVKEFDTYTEFSPSLTGLHLWVHGIKPGKRCKRKQIEVYDQNRYMAVTGNWLGNYEQYKDLVSSDEIERREEELAKLYDEAFNTTPIHGEPPELPEHEEEEEEDEHGFPLPSSRQWTFEEALFYVERVMQDGRPRSPANKMLAMPKNDRKFAGLWRKTDRQAELVCGDDQSAWDLAVANRLFSSELRLTWHEVVAILIDFREYYDPGSIKTMRKDYWARTIARASERFEQRREAKERKVSERKERAEIEKIAESFDLAETKAEKAQAIRDLCDRLGCPSITKITCCRRRNNSLYTIHFGDNEHDAIEGDISILTGQGKFRNAIADKARQFVPPMSAKRWEQVARIMLASVEDEYMPPDTTLQAQTIEWVQGYLAGQDRPVEFGSESYLGAGPWWYQGQLMIRLSSLETFLRRYYRQGVDRMMLARRLKWAGIVSRRVSYRIAGKCTSMSCYVVPDENSFFELARNIPKQVQVLHEEEEEEVS